MKSAFFLAALFLTLLVASVPARAEQVIEIGTGMSRSQSETLFLIEVETSGFGAGPEKYFVVKTKAHFGRGVDEHSSEIAELEIEVLPLSIDLAHGLKGQLRILPFKIIRELSMGRGTSADFEVIGWSSRHNGVDASDRLADYGFDPSPEAQKRLSSLGEIAIDAIGLSHLRLEDGRRFQGAQLTRIDIQKGISYQINPVNAISVVFEAVEGISYGKLDQALDGETSQGFAFKSEIKLEFQYAFDLLRAHYTAFLRGVYERFDLPGGAEPIHDRELSVQFGVARELRFHKLQRP
ncbi:MAG: hypothetical protein H7222_15005 [Methylotenera sp.]|nr:hypothetical protein [Oligoflexia bacterium]